MALKQVSMRDVFCGPLGSLWRLRPGILQSFSRSFAQHKLLAQVPLILSLCQIQRQRRALEDHENPRGKRQGALMALWECRQRVILQET